VSRARAARSQSERRHHR
jgi:transposase